MIDTIILLNGGPVHVRSEDPRALLARNASAVRRRRRPADGGGRRRCERAGSPPRWLKSRRPRFPRCDPSAPVRRRRRPGPHRAVGPSGPLPRGGGGRSRGRPAGVRPALDHVRPRVGDGTGEAARRGDGRGATLDAHRPARRVRRARGRRGPDRPRDRGRGRGGHRRRRAIRGPDSVSRHEPMGALGARSSAPLHLRCRDIHAGRGQGPRGASSREAPATRRDRGSGRPAEPGTPKPSTRVARSCRLAARRPGTRGTASDSRPRCWGRWA